MSEFLFPLLSLKLFVCARSIFAISAALAAAASAASLSASAAAAISSGVGIEAS